MRFGKLTAIRYTGRSAPSRGRYWLCRCDCGNYREVPTGRLTSKNGHIQACEACAKAALSRIGKDSSTRIADVRKEKLHSVWNTMKQRCSNPNSSGFKHYGGRGIKVCEEWRNSYASFKEWAILTGYREGLTIERIDVDGNYSPDNCKWITMREQMINRRGTRYIEYEGKRIPVAKMVYELGLVYNTVMHYLKSDKE